MPAIDPHRPPGAPHPHAAALDALAEGPDGALAGLAPKALWVDMSTIGRRAARAFAARVREAGGRFVDAPVSGTVGPWGRHGAASSSPSPAAR